MPLARFQPAQNLTSGSVLNEVVENSHKIVIGIIILKKQTRESQTIVKMEQYYMKISKMLLNFNIWHLLHVNNPNSNCWQYAVYTIRQGSRKDKHDFLSCSFD